MSLNLTLHRPYTPRDPDDSDPGFDVSQVWLYQTPTELTTKAMPFLEDPKKVFDLYSKWVIQTYGHRSDVKEHLREVQGEVRKGAEWSYI